MQVQRSEDQVADEIEATKRIQDSYEKEFVELRKQVKKLENENAELKERILVLLNRFIREIER